MLSFFTSIFVSISGYGLGLGINISDRRYILSYSFWLTQKVIWNLIVKYSETIWNNKTVIFIMNISKNKSKKLLILKACTPVLLKAPIKRFRNNFFTLVRVGFLIKIQIVLCWVLGPVGTSQATWTISGALTCWMDSRWLAGSLN